MKNNEELQTKVTNAIKWKLLMNASKISVTAKDGIVTLSGIVDSYAKKIETEKTAKNSVNYLSGIKGLADKSRLSLKVKASHKKAFKK